MPSELGLSKYGPPARIGWPVRNTPVGTAVRQPAAASVQGAAAAKSRSADRRPANPSRSGIPIDQSRIPRRERVRHPEPSHGGIEIPEPVMKWQPAPRLSRNPGVSPGGIPTPHSRRRKVTNQQLRKAPSHIHNRGSSPNCRKRRGHPTRTAGNARPKAESLLAKVDCWSLASAHLSQASAWILSLTSNGAPESRSSVSAWFFPNFSALARVCRLHLAA